MCVSIGGYTSNHNLTYDDEHVPICVSIGGYTSNHNFTTSGITLTVCVSIGGYTSNHNDKMRRKKFHICVSIGGYTSNHNLIDIIHFGRPCVSIGGYTSNHNRRVNQPLSPAVFLLAVIHQTTTVGEGGWYGRLCFYWRLYIKPQHRDVVKNRLSLCFYWRLYIKPQLCPRSAIPPTCVSIGGYTSNHNTAASPMGSSLCVSIGGYTSNHNVVAAISKCLICVSIGGYTSNHNSRGLSPLSSPLCFYWRLYIKPQPQYLIYYD